MKDYEQPTFYRFSSDSIELAKLVIERHHHEQIKTICDAFTGCGVIALELAQVLGPSHIIYNELQKEFTPYINKNHNEFCPDVSYEIASCPFSEFTLKQNVELLVANPPYFNAGEGRASENVNRQMCRHFVKDDFNLFLNKLMHLKQMVNFIYFVTREEVKRDGVVKLKEIGKGNSIYQLT